MASPFAGNPWNIDRSDEKIYGNEASAIAVGALWRNRSRSSPTWSRRTHRGRISFLVAGLPDQIDGDVGHAVFLKHRAAHLLGSIMDALQ